MKHSLNKRFLTFFITLGLLVGYSVMLQSLAQQQTTQEQTENDNDQETDDNETNDDIETSETEETEGVETDQNPVAIERFGAVSVEDAVKIAQTELDSSSTPFEVTLEQVNGQLTWTLDFIEPAMQVVMDADSGVIVDSSDLSQVPKADAILTTYGSLDLEKVVAIAQTAYGSSADVTEMALEKDKDILTWRIDIADRLVVIDAATGAVISVGQLN
jgi:uncharacterized membrane protein YkoI